MGGTLCPSLEDLLQMLEKLEEEIEKMLNQPGLTCTNKKPKGKWLVHRDDYEC